MYDITQPLQDVRIKWVWNWGHLSQRPYDLGYYIGFRIAESYDQHQGRSTETLIEMVDVNDYDFFYSKRRLF